MKVSYGAPKVLKEYFCYRVHTSYDQICICSLSCAHKLLSCVFSSSYHLLSHKRIILQLSDLPWDPWRGPDPQVGATVLVCKQRVHRYSVFIT